MDQPTGSAEATIKQDAELPVFEEGPNPADERQRVSALEQAQQEVLLTGFAFLESVANVLRDPNQLIFAPAVFPETGLGFAEHAPGLCEVVEAVKYHPLH